MLAQTLSVQLSTFPSKLCLNENKATAASFLHVRCMNLQNGEPGVSFPCRWRRWSADLLYISLSLCKWSDIMLIVFNLFGEFHWARRRVTSTSVVRLHCALWIFFHCTTRTVIQASHYNFFNIYIYSSLHKLNNTVQWIILMDASLSPFWWFVHPAHTQETFCSRCVRNSYSSLDVVRPLEHVLHAEARATMLNERSRWRTLFRGVMKVLVNYLCY